MNKPIPMRFQDRDARILRAVQDYGGLLAKRQIKALFWSGKSKRAMQSRLSKLKANGYIDWPSSNQRKCNPIPEPVIWVGWRGALYLANTGNRKVEPPKSGNENQLRFLERRLRREGFYWLREPRWSQLSHDLTLIDIRMKIEDDLKTIPHLMLDTWINESAFRSNMDRVNFTYKDRNGNTQQRKRGVIPDGFFRVIDSKRKKKGEPYKAQFLLEVDMATHSNRRFSIEKTTAGAAYISSKLYKDRFGSNSGRWLVVTTSDIRMRHLMEHSCKKLAKDKQLFYFTTLPSMFSGNVFTETIWQVCGETKTKRLVEA